MLYGLGPVKVTQPEMANFGFKILGLKHRNFLGFEPKWKSASKSGFELFSVLCNCWLVNTDIGRQATPTLNSDFSVIAD